MGKTPEMENTLDALSERMFGRKRSDAMESNNCVTCGEPAIEFKDALSKKEYGISGMCQVCQDTVFGSD